MKLSIILFSFNLFFGMAQHALQVKQGVTGRIYLKQGNNMPVPGRPMAIGTPVARTIYFYELTTTAQVNQSGAYFTNLKTKLIAKTQSDANGDYTIALAPGNYSVFVEDSQRLYANNFDDKGNINPVKVKADSLTRNDIVISASATY